jgi:DNA polymerase V
MKKGNITDGVVYHAGFPNAGEDQRVLPMGLENMIVKHRASTYLWRLEQPVDEFGWAGGSVVVVDRALEPRHGDKVVAVADNEFVIRHYQKTDRIHLLSPRGTEDLDQDIALWGVITYVLQATR